MTHVGIIGAGNVGGGLAGALVRAGHEVTITNSRPGSAALHGVASHAGASAGSLAEVTAADLVVLAVPFVRAIEVLEAAGTALDGAVLIDATNPLSDDFMSLTLGHTTSGAEAVAAAAPGARVVKAFNTVFASTYADPAFAELRQFVPVAGDDGEAKAAVMALAASIGFDAVDVGALKVARFLEPTVEVLIHLGYGQGAGDRLGLALLRG